MNRSGRPSGRLSRLRLRSQVRVCAVLALRGTARGRADDTNDDQEYRGQHDPESASMSWMRRRSEWLRR
jgi:hypothetical protein